MKKKVFISYHFNDKAFMGEVKKWLEEAGAEVIAVDEKDLEPESDLQAQSRISKQIGDCNLVLILVGNDTHNRPWVNYEVAVARGKQIVTFWVRLPKRTGAPPIEVRGLDPVDFDKNVILGLIKG